MIHFRKVKSNFEAIQKHRDKSVVKAIRRPSNCHRILNEQKTIFYKTYLKEFGDNKEIQHDCAITLAELIIWHSFKATLISC